MRKQTWILFFIFLLIAGPVAATQPWPNKPPLGSVIDWSHPLARGLVGCWLMNEGGGLKIQDIAKGNNGTITNATWKPLFLLFNGLSSKVNCGNNNSLNLANSNVTIVTQLYVSAVGWNTIVDKRTNTSNMYWFGVGNYSGKSRLYFAVDTTTSLVPSTTNIILNTWTHCAVVYNLGVGVYYYNGKPNGPTKVGMGTIDGNAAPLYIGAETGSTTWMNGGIKYVYIYNRGLSPSEIEQLYKEPYCFIRSPSWTIWGALQAAAGRLRRFF